MNFLRGSKGIDQREPGYRCPGGNITVGDMEHTPVMPHVNMSVVSQVALEANCRVKTEDGVYVDFGRGLSSSCQADVLPDWAFFPSGKLWQVRLLFASRELDNPSGNEFPDLLRKAGIGRMMI